MSDSIERFMSWQRDFNHLSQDRTTRQRKQLEEFASVVGGPPETTTQRQFADYLQTLSGQGHHPNTVRRKGNMVRPFFTWAWRDGILPAELFIRLKDVPNPAGSSGNSVPRPYTRKELERMWAALDARYPKAGPRILARFKKGTSHLGRGPLFRHAGGLQYEAILMLALHGGMRSDEIFRSKMDDISPDLDYLVVYGAAKGKAGLDYRMREVPMTADLRTSLHNWFQFRALCGAPHDHPWIAITGGKDPNAPGSMERTRPMSREMFFASRRVGAGWSLQRLRHTAATQWLRAGMPIEMVSQLLGHSNIKQTLAYAQILPNDVQRAALQAEKRFCGATLRPQDEVLQEVS